MRCRVRVGFYLHFSSTEVYEPGTLIDLSLEEFSRFAHQLELAEPPLTSRRLPPGALAAEEEPVEEEPLIKKELKRAKVQS